MAATIGKVRAVFTASTSGLTAGVNAASGSMKRMQSDVSGLRASMGSLVAIQGTQLFASFVSGAVSAGRSLLNMGAAATDAISQQNDLAQRLGLTYGELAGLSYAGSLVGVSTEQIGAAMTKAQVAFVNAANGSKTAQAAFARLGLSVADLNGLSAQQQFEAIAQAISQLPTEAEKAAAAVQIFGRAGAQLLPLFTAGADGISRAYKEAQRLGVELTPDRINAVDDALGRVGLSAANINAMPAEQQFRAVAEAISKLPTEAERAAAATAIFGTAGAQLLPMFQEAASGIQAAAAEAERFGLTLSNMQAANVDDMGDSFDRAKAAIQGVINQIVAYLAPAVTSVTTAFSDLIGSVGGATIGQTIGDGILQGARYFATVADYFIEQSSAIWQYASAIGGQWNAVWDFAQRVGQVFLGAFNVFEAVGNLVGGILSNAIAGLFRAAAKLADLVPGFGGWADSLNASADRWAGTVDGFDAALTTNANEAAAAFSSAFGSSQASEAGEAMAGPLTQTIDQAIAAAKAAADSVDVAAKQEVDVKVTQVVDAKQAIQGIESSSADGLKEMFRLMRGDTKNDIEERQLSALERIADNTADTGDSDFDVIDLAASAGA